MSASAYSSRQKFVLRPQKAVDVRADVVDSVAQAVAAQAAAREAREVQVVESAAPVAIRRHS